MYNEENELAANMRGLLRQFKRTYKIEKTELLIETLKVLNKAQEDNEKTAKEAQNDVDYTINVLKGVIIEIMNLSGKYETNTKRSNKLSNLITSRELSITSKDIRIHMSCMWQR